MTDFAHPTRGMHCPIHAVPLVCPCCHLAALGSKGGKAVTDAKRQAAKLNGAKGGRPKKPTI